MNITVTQVDYHRNGISGEGFHAVTFTADADGKPTAFVATVFDGPGQCAVLGIGPLGNGDVRFGHNSWRGDIYEPALRRAIAAREAHQAQAFQRKDLDTAFAPFPAEPTRF